MPRTLKIVIYIFVAILISCKTTKKDKINEQELSSEYFFPEEIHYYQGANDVLIDKLYPIGWSKNGNFAYIVEPADEGLGNYQFIIIIQNMVSNEVLWDWATEPTVNKDLYREDIWKENYKEFKKHLNKYGIIQKRDIKLIPEYFVYNDKDYLISLETIKDSINDANVQVVKANKVIITCKQMGKKIVAEDKFEDSFILGQQIAGCFLSPYEDRIAILVRSERWGYEGPPNIIEYKLYGTNLTTGFQK